MARKYFGTDGVRGLANGLLTPDLAMKIGQAAGVVFRAAGNGRRVVIGKDTRVSGYMIENALVAGFASVGVNVLQLGPAPTPAVAMIVRAMRADLGVMISASHNPFADNGIKLFGPDGFKLSDAQEEEIEALVDAGTGKSLARSQEIGRAKRISSLPARYVEYVKRTLPRDFSLDGLRVVIDCANGAAYKVAPEALWELGAEVVTIGAEPNGFNINSGCGSTSPDALRKKVLEVRADIGVALDGDADRVTIVDEKGGVIDGDQIIALIAERVHAEGKLSQPGVVATIMSNGGLDTHLQGKNLELVRTAVGDRYVIERMRAGNYNVGGEASGHIILADHATTGDGLVAGLQVLAAILDAGRPASEVCRRFEPLPQMLESVPTPQRPSAERLQQMMGQFAPQLGQRGRLLVRASGTEKLVRVMAEGEDHAALARVTGEICALLRGDALAA